MKHVGPLEPVPTAADLIHKAREAVLNLRADATRWEEDVDGDIGLNGRTIMTVRYHATFDHDLLADLCEAVGIRVPFGETAGDVIDEIIANESSGIKFEDGK